MVCQLVGIQVEKDFTQNPEETNARSVTQSERIKPALLFTEARARGAPEGHAGGASEGTLQKRLVTAADILQHAEGSPAHYMCSSPQYVQRDFRGRALLLWSPKKLPFKLPEPRIAQMACIPELGSRGRAMFAIATPANFDPASGVSVIATWFGTFKPPGTDTLKSHLLSELRRKNKSDHCRHHLQEPLGLTGQSKGPKTGTSEKELQGPCTLHLKFSLDVLFQLPPCAQP